MSQTRKLLIVIVVGLVFSGAGAVWAYHPVHARAVASDNPVGLATTSSTTSSSTSTTVSAERAAVPQPHQPVDVPPDPYANEPVQKIGTIQIPKIGLVSDIYHGITLRNIDLGPSHWPGTALPGENGNAVFAGHRVTHTHPFRDIDQLVAGDKVIFTVAGVTSTYVVTGHEVVKPEDVGIVAPTSTPTATLFACHPPHFATYRYVVHLALLAE